MWIKRLLTLVKSIFKRAQTSKKDDITLPRAVTEVTKGPAYPIAIGEKNHVDDHPKLVSFAGHPGDVKSHSVLWDVKLPHSRTPLPSSPSPILGSARILVERDSEHTLSPPPYSSMDYYAESENIDLSIHTNSTVNRATLSRKPRVQPRRPYCTKRRKTREFGNIIIIAPTGHSLCDRRSEDENEKVNEETWDVLSASICELGPMFKSPGNPEEGISFDVDYETFNQSIPCAKPLGFEEPASCDEVAHQDHQLTSILERQRHNVSMPLEDQLYERYQDKEGEFIPAFGAKRLDS